MAERNRFDSGTDTNNELVHSIEDVAMGRPHCFSVDNKPFFLYPITYGKILLCKRLIDNIGINQDNLKTNIYMEVIRLVKEKRDECLTIITYHTCKDKDEVLDSFFVLNRKKFLDNHLSEEDIVTLMIIVLTSDKTETIIKYYKIDKENDKLNTINRIKKSKNSLVFGGKSIFGILLDVACERYGWTKEYVMWGIDYASLRIMLADKITSVYLSDEELKKMPASVRNANEEIIKPTKENMQAIMSMDWK